MEKLTDRQRMTLVFDHQAPDRVPIIDEPWEGTLSRWKREGMPDDTDYRDFFGIDKKFSFGVDNSPQYEAKTIFNDGVSRIYTTQWGTTEKKLVGEDTTPQYLERRIMKLQTTLSIIKKFFSYFSPLCCPPSNRQNKLAATEI